MVDGFGLPPVPPFTNSDYVFQSGNSFQYDLGGNPASVTSTNWTADLYIFSVATLDFAGVYVSCGKLLTQLSIKVDAAATPGSRYQVSLGAGSFFQDEIANAISYTSKGGVITNNGDVNPVPGPSGALLAAIGSGLHAIGRLRRLRVV